MKLLHIKEEKKQEKKQERQSSGEMMKLCRPDVPTQRGLPAIPAKVWAFLQQQQKEAGKSPPVIVHKFRFCDDMLALQNIVSAVERFRQITGQLPARVDVSVRTQDLYRSQTYMSGGSPATYLIHMWGKQHDIPIQIGYGVDNYTVVCVGK